MRHQIKKTGHLSVKTHRWKFPDKHAKYKVYTIRPLKDTGLATLGPLVPKWASHPKRSIPGLPVPPLSTSKIGYYLELIQLAHFFLTYSKGLKNL